MPAKRCANPIIRRKDSQEKCVVSLLHFNFSTLFSVPFHMRLIWVFSCWSSCASKREDRNLFWLVENCTLNACHSTSRPLSAPFCSQFRCPPPNPCPPLGNFILFYFFTGQVVYLSHVWRPPESTTLLSLLRLFRLFYKETHPRARKEQETQSW